MKKFSPSRNAVIFVLASGVGLGTALVMHRYLKSRVAEIEAQAHSVPMVKVLVAKTALAKGSVITTETVAQREVPTEWRHSNAIPPDQFDQVQGQTLAIAAKAGEMLLWLQLEPALPTSFATRLTSGQRAVTVAVDEVNSVSGMIEPGDRVDLVALVKTDGQTQMLTLLQDATVLATGNRAVHEDLPEASQRHGYTTITLETSPQQARQVLAAREIGKLAALLRAPGDARRGPTGPDTATRLLGLQQPVAATSGVAVPVLYGNDPGLRDTRRAFLAGSRP